MPKGWPSSVAPLPGAVTDVNLIQYLGVACGPLNPVDTDIVDRAARLLGIIYGTLGQINQVVPADALAPGNALSIAGFNFVYNGATWDMVREGNVAGSILTDPTDRAARLIGVVYGSEGQPLYQDSVEPAAVTIDFLHHEIHEGEHWVSHTLDTDADIGDTINLLVTFPNSAVRGHLIWEVKSTRTFWATVHLDPTDVANGAAVDRWNSDLNVAKNGSAVTVLEDVTVNDAGADRIDGGTGGGTGPGQTGTSGSAMGRIEWVGLQDGQLLIQGFPLADDGVMFIFVKWYEA